MKAFTTIILILIVIAGIFFFSKPSDSDCISKGKSFVDARTLVTVNGYENPMYENVKGQTPTDQIIVKDKFLWKEVDYIGKGEIRTVGYAYLGAFHAVKNDRKKD